MATSSGKSGSSLHAAVLLVAVVLAGTCASGADAQFNITNLCNKTITITTRAANVSIGSGVTVNITQTPATFLVGPVSVTTPGVSVPVTITIPPAILRAIETLFDVEKIVFSCSGNCVTLTVTFTVLGGPPRTIVLGPVCASATLPPLPSVP
jgi:hypothetical protein